MAASGPEKCAEEGETGAPKERMGHPPVVHEAEDRAAEHEEKIQIWQLGPYHQRHGRRRTITLLEARLGQQRRGGQNPSEVVGYADARRAHGRWK